VRNTRPYRYEELARFITELVDSGALAPGSRAPSLRQISRQRRISLSGALQAYRLLEHRGILEARPQSGHYVARGGMLRLQAPKISKPPARATTVSVSETVVELLEHAADPSLVPLGCAIPSPELLAAGRLDRLLARTARRGGMAYNSYTVARGDARLRQEIARRALHWDLALDPQHIAITCGCTEALMLALKAVAAPGDTVIIESPTYFGLLNTLETLGLRALELPTDSQSGIDLNALEKALENPAVKACVLASCFNNPLGCTLSEQKKTAALDLLAERGVPLIEDDIYGDIHFGGERPRPFMALDRRGTTLYCSSFSKTLAPGYRIGWIASPQHLPRILEHKLALTLCGPGLLQAALAEFLASGGYDSHLRRLRRVFQANVEQMIRTIDKCFPEGTRVSRPAGGFVVWVELPRPLKSRELLAQALQRGVCFVPGDVFSAGRRFANCLRLSCGYPWSARIASALELLGGLARAAARERA